MLPSPSSLPYGHSGEGRVYPEFMLALEALVSPKQWKSRWV
ncbi:hypothetical protein [Sphaerisporangium perillae]|nr:hypothetical protein [Sphaerisporangium perillae]